MPINGRINGGPVVIAIFCGPVQVMGMNQSGIRRKVTKSEASQKTEIEYKKTFLEGIRFVKIGFFFLLRAALETTKPSDSMKLSNSLFITLKICVARKFQQNESNLYFNTSVMLPAK